MLLQGATAGSSTVVHAGPALSEYVKRMCEHFQFQCEDSQLKFGFHRERTSHSVYWSNSNQWRADSIRRDCLLLIHSDSEPSQSARQLTVLHCGKV